MDEDSEIALLPTGEATHSSISFARLVREVTQDNMAAPQFQKKAIEALQFDAESNLVKMYEEANLLGSHSKLITVYLNDFNFLDLHVEKLSRMWCSEIKFTRSLR